MIVFKYPKEYREVDKLFSVAAGHRTRSKGLKQGNLGWILEELPNYEGG